MLDRPNTMSIAADHKVATMPLGAMVMALPPRRRQGIFSM